MTQKVGDIFADFSLRTDGFRSGMRNLGTQLQHLGKQMEQNLGRAPQTAIEDTTKSLKRMTWTVRGSVKDTTRVVTGILIAQGFYKLLNTIEEATASVIEFSGELQQAAVSFELLLGSTSKAQAFMRALQDFAQETPYSFQQVERSARRLLAMGFSERQALPVMRVITDMAVVAGGTEEALDRISLALGQMFTKGRLMQQEINQLTEAGVPAMPILKEKLKLTQDQLKDIGRQGISANVAIAALLEGIEERFPDAAAKMEKTLPATMNRIRETLLGISQVAFAGPLKKLSDVMYNFSLRLAEIQQLGRQKGLQGIVEGMFPPHMRGTIMSLISSLIALKDAFKDLFHAIAPVVQVMGEVLLKVLTILLPIFRQLVFTLAALIGVLTQNEALVRALAGALTSLAIVGTITLLFSSFASVLKTLLFFLGPLSAAALRLGGALRGLVVIMARSPWLAAGTIVVSALAGIALASKNASDWIDRLLKQLAHLFGIDVTFFEKPGDPEGLAEAAEQYNQPLQEIIDSFKGTEEAAEDAGKAVKDTFIASFDEVHQIPEPMGDIAESLEGLGGDLGDLSLPDFTLPKTEAPDQGPILPIPLIPPFKFPAFELPKFEWPKIPPPPPLPVESLLQALEALGFAFLAWKLKVIQALRDVITGIQDWIRNTVNSIRNWGSTVWDILTSTTQSINQSVVELYDTITQSISGWFSKQLAEAASWSISFISAIVGAYQSISAEIGRRLEETRQSISGWFGRQIETAAAWGPALASTVAAAFASLSLTIRTTLSEASETVSAWFSSQIETISSWGPSIAAAAAAAYAAVGRAIRDKLADVKDILSDGLSSMTKFWDDHKVTILAVVGALIAGVILYFASLPSAAYAAIAGLVVLVTTVFADTKKAMAAEMEEATEGVRTKFENLKTTLGGIWNNIKITAGEYWEGVKDVIKGAINGIVSIINRLINYWNNLSFKVPSIDVGEYSFGGYTIGVPRIPNIPRLEEGGVITGDALYRAGEKNKEELVLPGTGKTMRTFARTVAEEVASGVGQAGETKIIQLYANTIIADERSMRNLAKKLRGYLYEEDIRVFGTSGAGNRGGNGSW